MLLHDLILKVVDTISFRLLRRQDPPVDLAQWVAENSVPGIVIRGDRELMRQLTGIGTGLPTFMMVNDKLELVYLSRGFDPSSFHERMREAILCNTQYCDPDSEYARTKWQYDGRRVPNVSLTGLDGSERRLADYIQADSIAVLDFWATWCPPCKVTFKVVEELKKEFEAGGVAFLSVNAAN